MTTCLTVLLVGTPGLLAGDLADPVRVTDADVPHAAPCFADIDGDGKRDLIVGQYQDDPYTGARLLWFRNVGTASAPQFGNGRFLQAGGNDAACDEFCRTGFGPQLVDFDGDGRTDLLSGSRDCRLFVFRGTKAGQFAAAQKLEYASEERNEFGRLRYNTRVYVYDWDGDGVLDVLAAGGRTVWLVRGTGGLSANGFAEPLALFPPSDGPVYPRAAAVADWDGDGTADLIVGLSDGSVEWHRNADRTARSPRLLAPVRLVAPGVSGQVKRADGIELRPDAPTQDIRLCVTDYNSDGALDLLVGDTWMLHRPAAEIPEAETDRRRAAMTFHNGLSRQLRELQAAPVGASESDRRRRDEQITAMKQRCAVAWQNAYAAGSRTTRHGSVWLFARLRTN